MESHPIENLMKSTMENLKEMIDVNTIIGDAIETKEGSYIVPISKVNFGFASGGSEFGKEVHDAIDKKHPFGGASGAGISVKPVAFLVLKNGTARLLPVEPSNSIDRLIDTVPQVIEMIKNAFTDDKTNS
ncbi:GerW family sporulation protein [Inconstantimicrobium mannanitabidum]|uniref:Sporulation protein YtfJ n=1 Tax=Inconstantimicrobium mannanitabidum TaxID=1604901 RepID=A0ACB5RAF2_9CLOT|nr:GerW family sporulation protein [Clostridium sp. TW13]GKX66179.1 sporulation protein YtfJ [Clostridium sp. TW13]